MKNFEFEHNGQKLWYSRSLACNLITIVEGADFDEWYVLACKRGQGCEFNKGLWNVPGGFIDFDEDSIDCAIRETWEETGVHINRDDVRFFDLNTYPRGARQTMVATHAARIPFWKASEWKFDTSHGEPGETEEVKLIPIKKLDEYNWAYGQKANIRRVFDRIEQLYGIGRIH